MIDASNGPSWYSCDFAQLNRGSGMIEAQGVVLVLVSSLELDPPTGMCPKDRGSLVSSPIENLNNLKRVVHDIGERDHLGMDKSLR